MLVVRRRVDEGYDAGGKKKVWCADGEEEMGQGSREMFNPS